MSLNSDIDITGLLRAYSDGDKTAIDQLVPFIYQTLRALAHHHLRKERSDHTYVTTALVHEAYLKLLEINQIQWKDRAHFMAMASRAMRRLLVDYANHRNAQKRGAGAQKVDLEEMMLVNDDKIDDILDLHQSLNRLEKLDPRKSLMLEYRYFGGLTNEEIVQATGLSLATVKRDMTFSRAWLANELQDNIQPNLP
ncbi:MAG: sigma-70 family RNA polymerase sigma factor [Rhodothermaceae bacterium]|nr:sigma-70 family RNA polymerase sigma factor [Rhodothermaceae bacterium]